MSETTVVEPPTETSQVLRSVSETKAFPPKMAATTPPPPNGFSFLQVAVLIGIAVVINGLFLLYVALRTPPSAAVTPPPAQPVVIKSPVPSAPAVMTPAPRPPIAVKPPTSVSPTVKKIASAKPAAPVAHPVKHRPVAAAAPTVSPAPALLTPPTIDTVEYQGPIVHMAWKSLGKDVTYKVYTMPNVLKPSFDFRFNKYGPSMDWFLNENKSWRYVAITVVGKDGNESALSNIIDTTPSLPKPEF